MSAAERARLKQAVRSKRMSERCERTSERTSEWPSTYSMSQLQAYSNHRETSLWQPAFIVSVPKLEGRVVAGDEMEASLMRLVANCCRQIVNALLPVVVGRKTSKMTDILFTLWVLL